MMQINIKSIFRVLTFSVVIGLFSSFSYGQQWGVVVKSSQTEQIGNKVFYIHTVARGNTFYSLSKVYGITTEEIKAANPGLGNDLKLGSVILIPQASKVTPEVSPLRISYDNYFYHVVKLGESLFSIAGIYGVKVDDIVKINELGSSAISPGYHLKIPEFELKTNESPQKAIPQRPSNKKLSYIEYNVQPKETLYSIAKRYGVGLETLKYINSLSGNDLRVGQIILLPKALIEQKVQESKDYIFHQVLPKESVYGISRNYGISIDQIKAINPGLTEAFSIGQEIKIPRKQNTKGYIQHQVRGRKEKLSDIAQEYEVSVSNLKEINPFAPSKLKRGETINIPVDFIDKAEEDIDVDIPVRDEKTQVEPEIYNRNRNRVFNVALMLPLYLNEVDSMLNLNAQLLLTDRRKFKAFRFLEFFEGAQIAVDSLRRLGMKINFQVYDVSDNELETALLLQDPALRELDLIISLIFSRNFAMVSDFSKKHRIPLVNVISKRSQIVYENPYVFKISPKTDALYNRVAEFIGENMADYNTFIVRNNPYQLSSEYTYLKDILQRNVMPKAPLSNALTLKKIDDFMVGKQETFLDTLQYELIKGGFSFELRDLLNHPFDTTWVNNSVKTVIYSNDSLNGILQQASLFRNNLIVAMGSDEVFAIELFTKLNSVRDSFNIKVIGLPDWQHFMKLDVDYSQAFSLRVLSENFVDYNTPEVYQFVNKFRKAYYKVPEIETYSFLGYDATFYFLQALFRFGDDLLRNIPEFHIPLLQNQLKFEKQARGGYENTYWNLYRQENYSYKREK